MMSRFPFWMAALGLGMFTFLACEDSPGTPETSPDAITNPNEDPCAMAGCAMPPLCGEPCSDICGCCMCSPSEISCSEEDGVPTLTTCDDMAGCYLKTPCDAGTVCGQDDEGLPACVAESMDISQACVDAGLQVGEGIYTLMDGDERLQLTPYASDIIRIQRDPYGTITDPTGGKIVVGSPLADLNVGCEVKEGYLALRTDAVVLRIYQETAVRMGMYSADDTTMLWEESEPLSYVGAATTQRMARRDTEYFYGGGMQNGYFSHRNRSVPIAIPDFSAPGDPWADGGHPNPAPFFMSTEGFGVFRNTFAPGSYDFYETVALSHQETRFDAFYFAGADLKDILGDYTEITGRPFLAPIYGLELGDADCYNDDGATSDVVDVAQGYRDNDMPGGWVLPNDGYSCGYTDLPEVVQSLHELGVYTGLWTEDGLDQIAWEVGEAGSRAMKLDIAWVYQGYEFALDAQAAASAGIEDNSDARRFVWSTMGWAGSHRYTVMWTGDNSGNWEYIRFQIPTVIGSGLSAQNYATGDIDGIFYGSAPTHVRDLQWKAFIPAFMNMSGWAPKNKQPWVFGEPYTTINRKYLKLKMRLMPYLYTMAHEAHTTGVPTVRAMVLEYPEDPMTWSVDTQYQFMSGPSFLVAPVYQDTDKRNGIYLPEGEWIDYWNGDVYVGPQVLDFYDAPLDTLPVFVKAGAIVPMWPQMLHHREKPIDPLTLDIYPAGESRFTLYEDDGVTQAHREGAYAEQMFSCAASDQVGGSTLITLGESVGDFTGKLESRAYVVTAHIADAPAEITLNGAPLAAMESADALTEASEGWFHDPDDRRGVLSIKTPSLAMDATHALKLVSADP